MINKDKLDKNVKVQEPVFAGEKDIKDTDKILEDIAVIEDEGLTAFDNADNLDEVIEDSPNELTAIIKRDLKVDTTDKEEIKKTKRNIKPTASTILLALIIVTAILSWFLGGQSFDVENNDVIATDKQYYGLFDVLRFLEAGFVRDIGGIWFLIIASGAMGVFIRTGAPQALMQRMKKSNFFTPARTLAFIMVIVSIVTTAFNANYLLIAISVFVVPLLVFNGYDIITALMALLFASAAGQMSSVFNSELIGQWVEVMNGKFGEADQIASVADGLVFRSITFILFTTTAYIIVWSYGDKIINDFSASKSRRETSKFIQTGSAIFGNAGKSELTTGKKVIMGSFIATIIIALLGIIQLHEFGFTFFHDLTINWSEEGHIMRIIWGQMPPLGEWGYLEVSYLFILLALVSAFVGGIPQRKFIQGMTRGINTTLNIVLILILSGALFTMLSESNLHYTIFFNILNFFGSLFGDVAVPIGAFFTSIIFSAAFPITQDLMTIIADIMPRLIIDMNASFEYVMFIGSAITIGAGLVSIILPTSAITVGLIWAFKIPYNKWVSAVWQSVLAFAAVSLTMIVAFTLLLA